MRWVPRPLVMKGGDLSGQRLRGLCALLLSASDSRPGTFLNTLLSSSAVGSPLPWVLHTLTAGTAFVFHYIISAAEVQKAGFREMLNRTAKALLSAPGLVKVFQFKEYIAAASFVCRSDRAGII